ncbi:TRAP transporter permease [Candidatus Formimonas warabiya]|uniref:C4-dicarboxylate ABC transporter permease n=1 Tax=Formimonas warabiya TaxID=1761012 RepID=A0A3G1KRB0_FORW1|nr:TRAP transporter permease [Candidatus Formimonas warabiya]ATW24977.1 C4-dicarboxylate ABC transporter permease [Candidatus Formimonas warabiya]
MEEGQNKISGKYLVKIIFYISIIFSLFQLYTAGVVLLTAMIQRTVHLSFVLVLIYLCYPVKNKSWRWLDYLLVGASLTSGLYILFTFKDLVMRVGNPNTLDIILGSLLILLILEATRRTTGWALTIVALVSLAYVFWGHLIPGDFGHRAYSLVRVVNHLYLTTEGIFGVTLGVAATYLVIFILFGAFLTKSGGASVFFDLAFAVAGWARGGPAKVACVSSGLMGMINGSPVANVVTCGAFTIPLMKRLGYRPEIAGAIESVAGSGGAIMPPIMGAGAFIMSELTGIPYSQIIVAAAIPAILYYLGLFFSIDFEAVKSNIKGLPREDLPRVGPVLKRGLPLFIPLAILLYLLLVAKSSPIKAAFWGIVATVVFNLIFGGKDRMTLKSLLEALESGAKGTLMVSIACTAVGIVVGVITLTGLGLAFTNVLMELAGQWLVGALLMTMVATIIMGMALPPAAAYIVIAAMAAPALVKVGLSPLVANLFIFYYTAFAPITPPVALAAYAAAGIAESHPLKTGWAAMRFAIAGFICPFMFIYSPALNMQGTVWEILISFFSAAIGTLGFAAFAVGWLRHNLTILSRAICFVGAVLMVKQGLISSMIGLALIVAVYLVPKGFLFLKERPRETVV